jgi:hypothetical protein
MDMSVDNDDDDDCIPPDRGHHHPGPLRLPRDPSTDIPLDPDLAESHYFDVDDFEADESESEACMLAGSIIMYNTSACILGSIGIGTMRAPGAGALLYFTILHNILIIKHQAFI